MQHVGVNKGCRLESSQQLSRTLKAASVVVFAATPKDQDRFFWSPQHPKVNFSAGTEEGATFCRALLLARVRADDIGRVLRVCFGLVLVLLERRCDKYDERRAAIGSFPS